MQIRYQVRSQKGFTKKTFVKKLKKGQTYYFKHKYRVDYVALMTPKTNTKRFASKTSTLNDTLVLTIQQPIHKTVESHYRIHCLKKPARRARQNDRPKLAH